MWSTHPWDHTIFGKRPDGKYYWLTVRWWRVTFRSPDYLKPFGWYFQLEGAKYLRGQYRVT